jgi:hypothetical protein
MAGTSKKTDPLEDAPKLPPEAQPKPAKDVSAAEAGRVPSDGEDDTSAEPKQMSDITVNSVDDKFTVTVDMPGFPKAADVKVKEGEHDPSLVEVPGLGSFRNGTTSEVTGLQLWTFWNHLQVTGLTEAKLPAGVTIKEGGK